MVSGVKVPTDSPALAAVAGTAPAPAEPEVKLTLPQKAKALAGALPPAYWQALVVVGLLYFARFDASFITLRAKTVSLPACHSSSLPVSPHAQWSGHMPLGSPLLTSQPTSGSATNSRKPFGEMNATACAPVQVVASLRGHRCVQGRH